MKLVKDFGYLVSQIGILSLFHFGLMAWIARVLGPEGVGLYGLINSIVQVFMCLLLYGLQPAAAKFIPEYLVHKEEDKIATLILNLYFFRFILGMVAAIILYASRNLITGFYKFEFLNESLYYGAIILFLYGLFHLTAACLQGFQKFRELFFLQCLLVLVSVIAILIFLKQAPTIISFFKGSAAGFLAAVLYGLAVIIFSLPVRTWRAAKLDFMIRQGRELLVYAWPAGLSFIFVLMIDNMGNLIVAKFLPAAAVGYFAFAYRLANYFSRTNSIWETLFLPKFSELFSRKKTEHLENLFLGLLKNLLFLNTIAAGLVLLFSPYMVKILGGEKFLAALPLFQIFVIINIIRGMNPAINSLYYTHHRTDFLARVSFLKCLLDLAFFLVIVPRLGIEIAALAILFSWVLVFYYNLYLTRDIIPDGVFAGRGNFGFSAGAMVWLCLLSLFYHGIGRIIPLLLAIIISGALFLKGKNRFFLLLKTI